MPELRSLFANPFARRWLLLAAIAAAPVAMAVRGLDWWTNIPESDEFVTVLDFLARLERGETRAQLAADLVSLSNEHRTLTSRLMFLALHGATGRVDFAWLAAIGCGFIVVATAVAALGPADRRTGWLLGLLLSLLVFNLQHYENLFCSCASADHFLVPVFSTGSLALLVRGGPRATAGALVLAGLAVFTLAHGIAVLPAGAFLLAAQRRWRALAAWSVAAALLGLAFFTGYEHGPAAVAGVAQPDRFVAMVAFWLTLCGGVPALRHDTLSAAAGLAGVVGWLLLWARGTWRREPFAMTLALCALGSMAVIAAGRAATDTPPLSSRYMVQSAFFWSALAAAACRAVPARPWAGRAAWAAVAVAAAVSVVSDRLFEAEAAHYRQRRVVAARHYDLTGSMAGLKLPVFPRADHADRFLEEAERCGIFSLRPPASPAVALAARRRERALGFRTDQLGVGRSSVHLRGWLLPPAGREREAHPLLVFDSGREERAFLGFREHRPDVAAMFDRPGAENCGFYFVVPRSALPDGPLRILVGYRDRNGATLTPTDGVLDPAGRGTLRPLAPAEETSRRVAGRPERIESGMSYAIDRVDVASDPVQVRGWLLPPDGTGNGRLPVLALRRDGIEHLFDGTRLSRPDVAAVFKRPADDDCGFVFLVPRAEIEAGTWQVSLGFAEARRLVLTPTDRTIELAAGAGPFPVRASDGRQRADEPGGPSPGM